MKRRKAIRNIVLFSLGTGVIYSCQDKYVAIQQLNLRYLKAEAKELDVLDNLSRLLVPLQNIPELAEHTALPFIMNMVDKTFELEDRQLFIEGYTGFDTEIGILKGVEFTDMTEEEKLQLLEEFNEEAIVVSPALYSVFNTIKAISIQYFTSTEYYQRKVNYYEMAPGRFRGAVPVTELKNMNDE